MTLDREKLATVQQLPGDTGPLLVSLWPSVTYRAQGRRRLTIKAAGGTTFSAGEQAELAVIFAGYLSGHIEKLRDVTAGESWAVFSRWGMHVDGHEAWCDVLDVDVDTLVAQIDTIGHEPAARARAAGGKTR